MVVFELFTDAVNDVRYKGSLKFPYPKDATDDQVDKLVAEVFTGPAAGGRTRISPRTGGQQAAPPAAARGCSGCQRAPAAPATTPRFPTFRPRRHRQISPRRRRPTISLGQTPDQVIAALGQPQKIVKLAKKEIYYYKDLKVIFTAGKVSDVQ